MQLVFLSLLLQYAIATSPPEHPSTASSKATRTVRAYPIKFDRSRTCSPPRVRDEFAHKFKDADDFARQKTSVRAKYSDPNSPHKVKRGGRWFKDGSGKTAGEFLAHHMKNNREKQRKRYHDTVEKNIGAMRQLDQQRRLQLLESHSAATAGNGNGAGPALEQHHQLLGGSGDL